MESKTNCPPCRKALNDPGVNGFNGNPDEIKKVQLLSPGSGWGHKGHE